MSTHLGVYVSRVLVTFKWTGSIAVKEEEEEEEGGEETKMRCVNAYRYKY